MRKREILNSPKFKEIKRKKRQVFKTRFLFFFILFILLFGISAFASHWDKINVKEIEISGVVELDKTPILEIVEEKISGEYLFIFPKTNIFIFPKKEIKEKIENTFHRFKNIDIKASKEGLLSVSLEEREPEYIWCGNTLLEAENIKECYFVDKVGYIYDKAPYFSGDVYFKLFGKISEDSNVIGRYFAGEYLEKINIFKNALESIEMDPVSLFVLGDGDMEIYLSSTGINRPKIIFKENADVIKLSENLQSALSIEPLKADFKNKYESLLYLDLRFDNKVYYKFK
ncbi:MAG: hypothetical protein K9L98_02460 [Candidatus Pacebacteria bacterium]|nr:hypothetical protein [Candidatus Paceibacterota bacterium]MCF7862849.1 hypothetical protein [Candidatus Paceibacterota bacterium]